ncbi:hypothetical protein ACS0TY_032736 [Phlomoides rotata]
MLLLCAGPGATYPGRFYLKCLCFMRHPSHFHWVDQYFSNPTPTKCKPYDRNEYNDAPNTRLVNSESRYPSNAGCRRVSQISDGAPPDEDGVCVYPNLHGGGQHFRASGVFLPAMEQECFFYVGNWNEGAVNSLIHFLEEKSEGAWEINGENEPALLNALEFLTGTMEFDLTWDDIVEQQKTLKKCYDLQSNA